MLGPLEVRSGPDPADGDVVEVGGARLRALLIMLALQPGRLVTSGQLIDGAVFAGALTGLYLTRARGTPPARTYPKADLVDDSSGDVMSM